MRLREKPTGPVFRLNTAAVSPSQPEVLRAALASLWPFRSRWDRQGHLRNQEQRRQAAPLDRIFGLGRAADGCPDALRLAI